MRNREQEIAELNRRKIDDLREMGIIAKYGLAGLLGGAPDLISLIGNLPFHGAQLAGYDIDTPLPYLTPEILKKIDEYSENKFQPENLRQKVLGTGAEFVGAGKGQRAFEGTSKLAKYLFPKDARDYVSLAGAGTGTELGKEYFPENPWMQFASGVAGGMTPGTLTGIAKTAYNPGRVLGDLFAVNPNKYEAFKKSGLTPSLSNISDSKMVGGLENTLREIPGIGNKLDKNLQNNLDKIHELNSPITKNQAGDIGLKGANIARQKEQKIYKSFDDSVRGIMKGDEPIDISNTLSLAAGKRKVYSPIFQKLQAEKPENKWLSIINQSSQETKAAKDLRVRDEQLKVARAQWNNMDKSAYRWILGDFEPTEEQLLGLVQSKQKEFDFSAPEVPLNDVLEAKELLGREKNNFAEYGSDIRRQFTKLYNTLSDDVDAAVRERSPKGADLIKLRNLKYSKFKDWESQFFKQTAIKKIDKKWHPRTPEEFFNKIYNDLNTNGIYAKKAFETLDAEGKKSFGDSLIRELGSHNREEFSPSTLARNFKKKSPEVQDIILSYMPQQEKNTFKAMIDSIDAMRDTAELSNKSRSYSNSLPGRIGQKVGSVAASVGGAIVAGNYFGAAAGLLGSGGVLGGLYGGARLMTNQKVLNWLAKNQNIKNRDEFIKHIGALERIGQRNPQIAKEISEYSSALKKEIDMAEDRELDEMSDDEFNRIKAEAEAQEDKELDEMSDEEFNRLKLESGFDMQNQIPSTSEENSAIQSEAPKGLEHEAPDIQAIEERSQIPELRAPLTGAELIEQTINNSATQLGLNPHFVRRIAEVESGLNPKAKAKTSSASGLFQFTNSTWRQMVKEYGGHLGIQMQDKNNPEANAIMGALHIRDNAKGLMDSLGRQPTSGEVYMAHFLGLNGARALIRNYGRGITAAKLFPKAAKANKGLFYQKGKPVTVEHLYRLLSRKINA